MKRVYLSFRIILAIFMIFACVSIFAACADTEDGGGEETTAATTVGVVGSKEPYSGPITLAEGRRGKDSYSLSVGYQYGGCRYYQLYKQRGQGAWRS